MKELGGWMDVGWRRLDAS